MKSRTSIALAVVAGFGLSAGSIHTLHAQARPTVLSIAEIDVSNVDAYGNEYAPNGRQLLRDKGAKILVASNNIVAIERKPAK